MYALRKSFTDPILSYEVPTNAGGYVGVPTSIEEGDEASVRLANVIPVNFRRKSVSSQPTFTRDTTSSEWAWGERAARVSQVSDSTKAHLIARLRMLKRLPANHDNEGAAAPVGSSVDAALAYLPKFHADVPYGVTLDDDGLAVIEFSDSTAGKFVAVTFGPDEDSFAECYWRQEGRRSRLERVSRTEEAISAFLEASGVIA